MFLLRSAQIFSHKSYFEVIPCESYIAWVGSVEIGLTHDHEIFFFFTKEVWYNNELKYELFHLLDSIILQWWGDNEWIELSKENFTKNVTCKICKPSCQNISRRQLTWECLISKKQKTLYIPFYLIRKINIYCTIASSSVTIPFWDTTDFQLRT